MAHNPTALKAAAALAVANCRGRFEDLQGRDINTDRRFGYQCMDLWNWFRIYILGFADILPTPDAASVWELNNQPQLRLWQFFDGITPDRHAMPGDVGIMNRAFFGNGVGHIFIVLRDLGQQLEVLELNGLGDGFEDAAGGQHGSPARVHTWPKTNLYGYLRWIGPTPNTGTITPAGTTKPKEWDEMATKQEIKDAFHEELKTSRTRDLLRQIVWQINGGVRAKKQVTMWRDTVDTNTIARSILALVQGIAAKVGQPSNIAAIDADAVVDELAARLADSAKGQGA